MSRFRRQRSLTIWPLALMLLWSAGCSRPTGLPSDQRSATADPHQVPFRDGQANRSGAGNSPDAQAAAQKPQTDLPFNDAQNLPAGTLLTVRLDKPVLVENQGPDTTFEAVVEEPIVIDGNTLVSRGTTVEGRVESSRAPNTRSDRGSVRLTLDSIRIAGLDLPIQTASLFAREAPQNEPSASVGLEKGRRLTFRLAEPLYISGQRASAGH